MMSEGVGEGEGGGGKMVSRTGQFVADGTTDFLSEDEPMEGVDVVGAREEGTDCFGEGIEGEWGR
jgi:hypothetical protein